MPFAGQKWKEKEHFQKRKRKKKKGQIILWKKRARCSARKSAFLKAKLEESTLCIKLPRELPLQESC